MEEDFTGYHYFKGEDKCPFKTFEESYLWCIEKDCYKYNLSAEEQKQRIESCLANFEDRIGIRIQYAL
jgi:hypothetical protein